MSIAIIIPARFQSTRFPGKPLCIIHGKTMIERVYEQAKKSNIGDVYVATDDDRIVNEVERFGGKYVKTPSNLPTGTDRVAYSALLLRGKNKYNTFINLQGDMPFARPEDLADCLKPIDIGYDVGTIVYDMDEDQLNNSNSVKAIVSWDISNSIGKAHWFCRSSLKYGYHHAGIYSFDAFILNKFIHLEQSPLEKIESLEQLRFLENNFTIGVVKVNKIKGEINTPEDLEKANQELL